MPSHAVTGRHNSSGQPVDLQRRGFRGTLWHPGASQRCEATTPSTDPCRRLNVEASVLSVNDLTLVLPSCHTSSAGPRAMLDPGAGVERGRPPVGGGALPRDFRLFFAEKGRNGRLFDFPGRFSPPPD
jgi:hypothetical protein